MSYFYFGMATTQLIRLFIQTEAHPRTAMLVKTLRVGFDDIAHFGFLFCIIVGMPAPPAPRTRSPCNCCYSLRHRDHA